MTHVRKAALIPAVLLCCPVLADETPPPADTNDLTSLSLEQLMNEPVTSVSKKQTRIGDSAAAITVITPEDIKRLGITSIPEALRLVPGMEVARVSPSQWAVTARGFSNDFANKLLVLIDGRTVYTPTSSGVFWDSQDVVMEDIDRIEVIRGPGATLWGANAVNGVINIITKSARETQGGLVSVAGGNVENVIATARYGDQVGPDFHWRGFVKHFERQSFEDQTRTLDQGDWNMTHIGARADWQASGADALTIQGDAYSSPVSEYVTQVTLNPPSVLESNLRRTNNGVNALARWTHSFSENSLFTVQGYTDHVKESFGVTSEHRDDYDLDIQHEIKLGTHNDLVWGFGIRHSTVDLGVTETVQWTDDSEAVNLFNLFLQDQIALLPDRLTLTLGSKFEHNNLSGWFVDPDLRFAWTPTERQTIWAGVAKASRTPSLFELGGTYNLYATQHAPSGLPLLLAVQSNPDLAAEQEIAYELGYRLEPMNGLSLDLSTYYDRYSKIISADPSGITLETEPPPLHLVDAWREANLDSGKNYGAELALQWQVLPQWKVSANYTFLHMNLAPNEIIEQESPRHQFQVRSYLDLPGNLQLNAAVYYVGDITVAAGAGLYPIPSYWRGDAGVVWKPIDTLSIGVWGQNLFQGQHLEYASSLNTDLFTVPRSWLAKANWKF